MMQLSGAWLLADLDGTLISTPHKAHGQYLSLEQSPCLDAIRRWLLNGGNVCVVTTADKRVLGQLYTPLKPILRDAAGRGRCGELLLSLYTGAVLYRCTADGVEIVRDYAESTHCATGEAVELSHRYGLQLHHTVVARVGPDGRRATAQVACVKGTCFTLDVCEALLERVGRIFVDLVEKALCGEPAVVAAFDGMSARYKKMWRLMFAFLDAQYTKHGRGAVTPAEVAAWKRDYLWQRRRLLRALGIIRVELADSHSLPLYHNAAAVEDEEARRLKAQMLRVIGDDTTASCSFVDSMLRLLGTEPWDMDGGSSNEQAASARAGVAQVIVVGIPLRLFSSCFDLHIKAFARFGVTAIPQPNSVVFSKLGVCKSTVIRYLMGRELWPQEEDPSRQDVSGCGPNVARAPSLRGVVNAATAIALGDNPHTTDYELTVFPQLLFISVERAEQRSSRHAHIREAAGASLTCRRGPLMDDRRLPNLRYVGGEEAGTAAFLAALMNDLHVPTKVSVLPPSQQQQQQRLERDAFAHAVTHAAAKAFAAVGAAPSHL
ncbi:hypothetical protein DQ04_00611150 [Trypanosoma grayi]|uniref:hypothetical protein n=1 Tax=Trypanosoma grayi TaxID=71804 RepID=UPI0004F40DB0|nr:hypothetical protein DQ04_00611150 [Trypanosoma grayi]KEG14128.1 hypothetical protein DQ04_00611150 [Trypanosoma grayi]